MGADFSTACHPTSVFLDPKHAEELVLSQVASHKALPPRLLRIVVPKGPCWVSGLYRLVEGRKPNNQPLWKATHAQAWLYSMQNGKWGIGGLAEFEAEFKVANALVFCNSEHRGALPHCMLSSWVHNRPAWTLDADISVEVWPETVLVRLKKESPQDKFGMQAAIVPAPEDSKEPLALRMYLISGGSLLARWNAKAASTGSRHSVVPPGSDILRVGSLHDPKEMLAALLKDSEAEVLFRRPDVLAQSRPDLSPVSTSDAGSEVEMEFAREETLFASVGRRGKREDSDGDVCSGSEGAEGFFELPVAAPESL